MIKTIHRIVTLKEFIDFAYSLKEMEEVVKSGFPIPTTITYKVSKKNHESLQKEILKEKKMSIEEFSDDFDVEFYGITFKFLIK